MSTLRDIRIPAVFKTVTNQLHRNLKGKPTPTLQQLQGLLAVALGARNLDAFYAGGDTPPIANHPTPANTTPKQWVGPDSQALFPQTPYVLVLKNTIATGKPSIWYGGKTLVVNHDTFSTNTNFDFAAMSFARANRLLENHPDADKVTPFPLAELLPDLQALLLSTPDELPPLIRAQHPQGALICDYIGCDIDGWELEVSNGDTLRGYAEWVAAKLEQWVDEQRREGF